MRRAGTRRSVARGMVVLQARAIWGRIRRANFWGPDQQGERRIGLLWRALVRFRAPPNWWAHSAAEVIRGMAHVTRGKPAK